MEGRDTEVAMHIVFGSTGGLCSSRVLREAESCEMAAARWGLGSPAERPWEVAILGGLRRDEQAVQREVGVIFQGCVYLCIGKRDWASEWGRSLYGERGEGLGEI